MYQIEEFDEHGLLFFRLKDEAAFVDICPERGGMVTAFHTDGEEILFMNEETLFDANKNVRGGMPVLFPIAGQLTDKTYEWNGSAYKMDNHGLARTRPWTITGQLNDDEHAELTLSFHSDNETQKAYPFDFEVLLTYVLANGKLNIRQEIRNLSADPMPVCPGYHPYFNIIEKDLSLNTGATKYLDYNDNQIKPFTGTIDMKGLKESVVLLDGADTRIEASFSPSKKIVIEQDEPYRYTVLWVEGDQPFVCIEPWTARTNAFNEDRDSLLLVKSGEPLKLNVSFHLENR